MHDDPLAAPDCSWAQNGRNLYFKGPFIGQRVVAMECRDGSPAVDEGGYLIAANGADEMPSSIGRHATNVILELHYATRPRVEAQSLVIQFVDFMSRRYQADRCGECEPDEVPPSR